MKKPGMRGKTLASTTRRPVVPCTRKSLVNTPPLSAGPMGQVHEAWWPQAFPHRPHAADALDDRSEVLAAVPSSFLEISKVDGRRIARVLGGERHAAAAIVRVRLEDREGEVAVALANDVRVAGVIAGEARDQTEHKEIGILFRDARAQRERDRAAVRKVHALVAKPRAIDGIIDRKLSALETFPGLLRLVDDADLVAVLKIASDSVEGYAHVDSVMPELLGRPDAGQHEQLRRVESAAGEDHFATEEDLPHLAPRVGGERGGAI